MNICMSYAKKKSPCTFIQQLFQGWLDAFHHFFQCRGRTSRSGFWFFAILNTLVLFCLFIVDDFFRLVYRIYIGGMYYDYFLLTASYFLITAIPLFCLCVRRLHDIGASGKWMVGFMVVYILLPFYYIHFLCQLLLLIVASFPSDRNNRFGMKPVHDFTV